MAFLVQNDTKPKSGDVVCRTSGMRFKSVPTREEDSRTTDYRKSNYYDGEENHMRKMTLFEVQPLPGDPEVMCGLGTWRPSWLQKFATHQVYAVSFVIVGIVQGMIYSYFNGVITTVEKAFGIPSRTLGIVLSGNDISQILCGLLVVHLGGKGSRPLWLAMGLILSAASCFIYASTQLFWDDGEAVVRLASKASSANNPYYVMCMDNGISTEASAIAKDPSAPDPCDEYPASVSALAVFFVGQFVSGVGSTALFSLGFSYMDDSVTKKASPLYFTLASTLRSFGPTLGYVLASFCLKTYIDPSRTPDYSNTDPRWLGAWWLGFLVVGTIQLFITFPIVLFPKRLKDPSASKVLLPKKSEEELQLGAETETELSNLKPASALKDFLAALRRLLTNPILVFSLCGSGPLLLGVIGYSTFLPKYLEAQFGQTASQASIFTGMSGMAMIMAGNLAGGLLTYKLQPRASYVAIYSMAVDIIYVAGVLFNMNIKCDSIQISGASLMDGRLQVNSTCSLGCNCPDQFNPVCLGNQNFLSPCLAGCDSYLSENSVKTFFNCTCGPTSFLSQPMSTSNFSMLTATSGYCPRESCPHLWTYIIVLGAVKLMASTTRVGGLLVFVRSVDKKDKALAMALMGVVISIIGFIPSPIIYGAVVDSTCLLWETMPCGRKGNCWLYNIDDFRYYFHGITMICFIIAIVFDLLIAIYSRRMNLYSDEPPSRILTFKEGFQCQTEKRTYDTESPDAASIALVKKT